MDSNTAEKLPFRLRVLMAISGIGRTVVTRKALRSWIAHANGSAPLEDSGRGFEIQRVRPKIVYGLMTVIAET
jgi:hypothetical protein